MKPDAAYDLALYEMDGHSPPRGILVVFIILVFEFNDAAGLTWSPQDKLDYMAKFKKERPATPLVPATAGEG